MASIDENPPASVRPERQQLALKLPNVSIDWTHFHLNEYMAYFGGMIQKAEGVLKRSDEGALLACMSNDMWNSVLFEALSVADGPSLNLAMKRWEEFFAAHGVDHYDSYFPSTIPNKDMIDDALKANGFRYWAPVYGMELDLERYSPLKTDPVPEGLEIEYVPLDSASGMEAVHMIAATNFLEPHEHHYRAKLVALRRAALEEPYYRYYVGKFQGEPVATISISMKHAYAGIAQISDVTTLEAHRGKRYASTLMQFALNECKKFGFKWAVLQGEKDGPMRLYQRLGFVASCQIDVWEKPSQADEQVCGN